MNRVSPEFQARRIQMAGQFDNEGLSRETLTASDVEHGAKREELLRLVAAARPDLEQRREVDDFLDDARNGDEFGAVTVRRRGSGVLVAAMWAERFRLGKHVKEEDQEEFTENIARLEVGDLLGDAYYASNAAVHPEHRRRGLASRALAAVLTDPTIFPEERAIFYRISDDNYAGEGIGKSLGIQTVFTHENRRGGDSHFNLIIASPEAKSS